MYQKKLLIVDDDALIRWALQKECASVDIVPCVAGTAADTLSELRSTSYDLVFLDVNLPDGNGLELIEEIRRLSPASKIVIMSSDTGSQNRERAIARGAFQFLEKPFDRSEVHSVLKSAFMAYPQQRKHPRFFCRIPLRISIVSPAAEESHFELDNLGVTTADVGAGGLRVRSEYPLRKGQSVRTHVETGNGPVPDLLPPEATAEVVWVTPARNFFTAGLKFLN
jgi:DNA-binding response OmpR family regulator